MNDYSFLRLENTLSKALDTRPSRIASIPRFDQVQLLPSETYLQTSNNPDGIAFDGNFSVFLCDTCGTELHEITSYVAINDILVGGIPQIEFEIAPMPYDFYKRELTLKFVHTVSSFIWYSSPFVYTDFLSNQTTRFDYLTSHSTLFQSIRLACYYTNPQNESQSKEYVKIDGQKVNSEVIITELERYYFDYCNGFNYRRLNRVLASAIAYVDGFRKTNRLTIEAGEPIADTDLFPLEFSVAVNYDETYTPVYQIHDPFDLINELPANGGVYTLDSLPIVGIQGFFNRDYTVGVGEIKIYKDSVLIQTYTEIDVITAGNSFDFTDDIFTENGVYYVTISEGLFISIYGENFSITDALGWTFEIVGAEYDENDYSDDYLI